MDTCPSCCPACSHAPCQDETYRGAYALDNFIPAGVLETQLNPDDKGSVCSHVHAADGWHLFSESALNRHLLVNEGFCREIDFLIKHNFISVTYLSGASLMVFLRIYIIPYDLANVKGELRIRKEAVLTPARRYLKNLLPKISQNHDLWNGRWSPNLLPPLLPNDKDRRTLAEIYGDLRSPQVKLTQGHENIMTRLLDFSDDLGELGLHSSLYNYQRRSVTALIQREMDLRYVPDPLFIPLSCMKQGVFYLQPGTMEILRERPTVAPSRGGILCEELGTGKTVMILALILATLNQLPSPEESIVDDWPILTPLSFRHFPSPDCVAARKRFFRGREDVLPVQGSRLPSLVELLLHRGRANPDTEIPNVAGAREVEGNERRLGVAAQVEQIRLGGLLRANTPFYYHYHEEPNNGERGQRKNTDLGPRKVYLTSATLILVPPNLLSQWDREIQKHCSYPLRVLILRSKTPMPHVASLASDYDIILMTYQRFTIENRYNDKAGLHSWKPCRCPEFSEARIPDCKCQIPNITPLLQIRWKRLVIDEGHVSASLSTVLTPFTKLLSVERRWIVTGTPTTNLLGLSLGKTNKKSVRAGDPYSGGSGSEKDFSSDRSGSGSPVGSQLYLTDDTSSRVWTRYDREDLNKLGKMITHFIAAPSFSASPKVVSTHIVEPLLDPKGPRPGAIQVLNQVMEMTMIRHRIEDVEDDVVLPPLMHEPILLDLDSYAIKSYNAMQATIAINAVDSQRIDRDYMFHPRNVEFLLLTVKNMSQIMFWSTDDGLYNVDDLVKNAHNHISRAVERNMPREDIALLEEAFKHVELAASDSLWRAMQTHEDVPYRVRGMQQAIFDAWTRTPQMGLAHDNSPTSCFLHVDRLLKMQEMMIRRPRISETTFVEHASLVALEDDLNRKVYRELQKSKGQKLTRKLGKHSGENNASLTVEDAVKKAKDLNTLKEVQKDLEAAMTRLSNLENQEGGATPPRQTTNPDYHGGSLLATSLLSHVRLSCTTSSKLNYIINEVLQYSHEEKFLIFSDSELSLAHISEALKLMRVKFLCFTTQFEPRVREEMVLTFETSDQYRVFLMELKHGARGLNLISASRVIFCEPVWQADVESQAIKRAHRIGQTRSITVKTLAIRGTAEENMVARRAVLTSSQEKVPKLIEEAGMRHYIANPAFINYSPERYPIIDLPLLMIEPGHDDERLPVELVTPSLKRIRPVEDCIPPSFDSGPPKKKRIARFE